MKKILITPVLFMLAIQSLAQEPVYETNMVAAPGADDHGMKAYVLVILKTGDNPITKQPIPGSIFIGRMNNIRSMADEGKMMIAGHLFPNDNAYRCNFILNTTSPEDACGWVNTDRAVKSKVMDAELYKWYAWASPPAYHEVHNKTVNNFTDIHAS